MPAIDRLTSLERVRDWVGVTTNNDDILLNRMIDEVSRFILSYLQRPTLFKYMFSDVYDGIGNQSQTLRHFPVQSVSLVMVDNAAIPVSSGHGQSGYVVEVWDGLPPGKPQAVRLRGYEFPRGFSNVNIVYMTGFMVNNEAWNVPASGNYTIAVAAPYGSFGMDNGVTYSNGTPLTYVASNPAIGQYTVNNGIYGFSAADAGAGVLITYSYIPSDIENACVAMIGERYRYKSHIGESSKSLGSQVKVLFSQSDIPDFVHALLQPYKRVVAI